MKFTKVDQQLRAHRLEPGLRGDEISMRIGVPRAALYRCEKAILSSWTPYSILQNS